MTEIIRCGWSINDPLYIRYHDEEWGVPLRGNEHRWFEFLILEGTQAGLSWITILRKRENYRAAFDGFDPAIVARYDADKFAELMSNPGIIRNRMKIEAAIQNANAFLKVQAEFGSFETYIWQFVGGQTIVNHWSQLSDVPAETAESRIMSKDMLKRGFRFVGPIICYSIMQACGLVNDHTVDCFRHAELNKKL